MLRHRSQLITVWFFSADLMVTAAAWIGAYYLRFETSLIPLTKDPLDASLCLANLPLVLLLATGAFHLAGQYTIHRLRRLREEVIGTLNGTGLLALFVAAATFLRHDQYESRATLLLFAGLTGVGLLTMRRLTWDVDPRIAESRPQPVVRPDRRRGPGGPQDRPRLAAFGLDGHRSVGFVDDQPNPLSNDLDVLGGFADLPDLVSKYGVSHVFIALPLTRYVDARRAFDLLSQSVVEVRLVADVPNLTGLSLSTTNLDGLPVIGLRESPTSGSNVVVNAVWTWCCRRPP